MQWLRKAGGDHLRRPAAATDAKRARRNSSLKLARFSFRKSQAHGCLQPAIERLASASLLQVQALLLFVPFASDAARLLRRCLPAVGRKYAVAYEGDKMRAYSLSELFPLTRAELFALHARIAAELPALSDSERETTLQNLRRVRRVLARARLGP